LEIELENCLFNLFPNRLTKSQSSSPVLISDYVYPYSHTIPVEQFGGGYSKSGSRLAAESHLKDLKCSINAVYIPHSTVFR